MLRKIKSTIKGNSLLRTRDRVLVAVSGGADSVALLVALCRLGYDCIALHCNFHLRGDESTRDMRSVEALCARLGIELHIKDFDVAARRKESGESIEMACRSLRYAWFAEQLEREQAAAIAVGHHREDRIETFFLNLLRGTGLTGLTSMRPRSGNVVRPLLDCSRADIEQFLIDGQFAWVDDSSNASNEFLRNRLRNDLLPLMEQLFPGSDSAVLSTIANLEESKQFYDRAMAAEAAQYANFESTEINLQRLSEQCPDAPLVLFERLRSEGFTRRQTDDMLRAAANAGGRFIAGRSHCRTVDHGILRAPIAAIVSDDEAFDVSLHSDIISPIEISVDVLGIDQFAPQRNPDVIYLDSSALEGKHQWQLRRWRRGDRIRPFGLGGSKLLSDIFASARLSESEKRSAWLLTCDDQIVWAVGLRASALFPVGEHSSRFIRLQFRKSK